ncbi:uncharacterized protein LOC123221421 [Mangifera indica]|uniref:uncharacterized protein LOC123221421 n=1 Tax=Mangifera indica TaxID=29780 RepID=UPI001CFC18DA|nr:uncharacterized protein LOC123221421 [Mangifera indica]
MRMDELIESLLTYEMKRKPKEEKIKAKKDIALKIVDKNGDNEHSMDKEGESLLGRKFSKKKKEKKDKRFKKKVLAATWSGSVDFTDESEPKEERTNICFITKSDLEEVVCIKAKKKSSTKWYLDSRCSRHMTGDKSLFLSLKAKDAGNINFGDKSK